MIFATIDLTADVLNYIFIVVEGFGVVKDIFQEDVVGRSHAFLIGFTHYYLACQGRFLWNALVLS
jgi:hypothetical protein